MTEEIVSSPAKPQKPTEDLPADARKAWRLAAILLVSNVMLSAAVALTSKGHGNGIAWIVALVLAYNLNHRRVGTSTAVMALAGLGCAIAPFVYFRSNVPGDAWILTASTWGFAASLFMLLLGTPGRARRIGAVITFCLLPGGVAVLIILYSLSRGR
jgi:hypothetical protein